MRKSKTKPLINVFDDTVEIPAHVAQVLCSIVDQDYDEPLPRCKDALRWLEERELVVRTKGDIVPVRATLPGRILATRRGMMTMNYRTEEARRVRGT